METGEEEFDFIVIGGGPGGCVCASRLTEDTDLSAVLVESGPDRRGLMADQPALGTLALMPRKSSNNWGLQTESDPGLNNRSDYHSLGRGLGGGSSINTLMYMRGNRADYDEWATLGNPGWSYSEVLPYFIKSENNQTHHNEFHGNDGPMWVEELRTDNPYHGLVKQACKEAGFPYNPDFNGADQEGYNSTQVCMKNGVRWHVGKAYIHPYLDQRPNLTMLVETDCTRILFEGKRAVGVEIVHRGTRRTLRCRKEVIVSGGGILSAKLLQLSGVGDASDLQALGIPVVHHLPAVGKQLQDHLDVVLGYHIPADPHLLGISPTGIAALWKGVWRWKNEQRGLLATNFAELTGFTQLEPGTRRPEIQYEFVIALAMDHGRDVFFKHGMSVHVLLLNPKSTGTVKLASADYTVDPLVDFRYLSHPDDLPTFIKGIKASAAIMETPTFKTRIKRDLFTAHCNTDAHWEQFVRNSGGTNYHPVGSCRMGPDASDSVVDARLRIHGMEGIRVIDCSIMPRIVRGNTMAPSVMIGEKGADMIKQDWQSTQGGLHPLS